MTSDEIQALDGPALTKLAVQLGLMDTEHFHSQWETGGRFINLSRSALFAPHEEIAQADALFRSLRARGWSTRNDYYAPLGYGDVWARKNTQRHCIEYQPDGEAMALLCCVVLSVSGEKDAEI